MLATILEVVYKLVQLSKLHLEDDYTAVQHIKLALRAEPEQVASILSHIFVMIASLNGPLAVDERFFLPLPVIIGLWDMRSEKQEDSTSDDALASICLASSLRLLLAIHNFQGSDIASDGAASIEKLVARHVILPMRKKLFVREPTLDESKFVRSVSNELVAYLEPHLKSDRATDFLPLLFEIAVRSSPRDTFRRQQSESPWLEAVLIALAHIGGFPIESDLAPSNNLESTLVLQNLLQIAIDKKIALSLVVLSRYASYYALSQTHQTTEWSLIAKIVSLGVDVFLPNSGINSSSDLLSILIDNITAISRAGSDDAAEDLESVKAKILIPLMRGFARARALSSFIDIWHTQLRDTGPPSYPDGETLNRFSVWEDRDVLSAFSEHVKALLTTGQIESPLSAAVKALSMDSKSSYDLQDCYAQIVIVNGLLESDYLEETLYSLRDLLVSLFEQVSVALKKSSKKTREWRWRIWRLARSTFEKISQISADSEEGQSLPDLLVSMASPLSEVAVALITKTNQDLKKGKSRPYQCLESFEAFSFIATSAELVDLYGEAEFDNAPTEQIIALLSSSISPAEAPTFPWDGQLGTLGTAEALSKAYLISILERPLILAKATSAVRRELFKALISLTAQEKSTNFSRTDMNVTYRSVLSAFASHKMTEQVPDVAQDIMNCNLDYMEATERLPEFLIDNVLTLPMSSIPRPRIAMVLNKVYQSVSDSSHPVSFDSYMAHLSIIKKLLDLSNSKEGKIVQQWQCIGSLAAEIPKLDSLDQQEAAIQGLSTLQFSLFRRLHLSGESQLRASYVSAALKDVQDAIRESGSIKADPSRFLTIALTVTNFWSSREIFEALGATEYGIVTVRQEFFAILVELFKAFTDDVVHGRFQSMNLFSIILLNTLAGYADLCKGNKAIQKALRKLDKDDGWKSATPLSVSTSLKLSSVYDLTGEAKHKDDDEDAVIAKKTSALLQSDDFHNRHQSEAIAQMKLNISFLGPDQIVKQLRIIRTGGFQGVDATSKLLLTGTILSSLRDIDRENPISSELSSLFNVLARTISQTTSIETFCLSTECIDMILRHNLSITQYNIDNILAQITIICSAHGPSISPDHAPVIFVRLCRLTGLLISTYRQKLGGRYHLLLPVLQNLLGCLFVPEKRSPSSSYLGLPARHRPSWLSASTAITSPTHTTHYTRLLTLLASPTVSSVTASSTATSSSSSTHHLTDATAKAKSIAGRYLQYLIATYITYTLHGSMDAEAKTALMPGLYVVIDSMNRETMRAMSAGLGGEGRAVWRTLFDSWVRFGKWDKN